MSREYRRLTEKDVQVGKPLSHSVYDAANTLLLKKGYIVATERQKDRLLNQKVFISLIEEKSNASGRNPKTDYQPEKPSATISVFDWVETHYLLISDVYNHFENPEAQSRKKVEVLAVRILRVSEKHSDGLLAAVQLATGKVYSHIKALHVGLLCEALGRRAGLTSSQRLSLISAGLTHDLGMWKLQELLRSRQEPLSDEQWTHIRSHPQRGKRLLQKAGVLDSTWLQTVEQHHERLNGSGYPNGLSGNDVSQTARILAVADTFSAMVRTRGDRDQLMPKEAMRDLFLSRGEEIDSTLAQLFIKEMGLFPPGSGVRLASGEMGIVTGVGNNASNPDVEVVFDATGSPLKRQVYRDTTEKKYSVIEMIIMPEHPWLDEMLPNIWPKLAKRI